MITLDYHRADLIYPSRHRRLMNLRILLLLPLLLLGPWCGPTLAEAGPPVIVIRSVHPGGATDWEHAFLENLGDGRVDLTDWSMTDGEGTWTMPDATSVGPGERVSVGVNSSAFSLLWGRPLDVVVRRSGSLCLADKGDSLVLSDAEGGVVDQLAYGDTGERPPGWDGDPVPTPSTMPWGRLLARRGPVDTDTSSDWTGWTEPRCGWREPSTPRPPVEVNVSTFVTPEGGWETLAWLISTAREELAIALYDITSLDLAAALADRARRGVRTRLLVEGTPVGTDGGQDAWRSSVLAAMADEGVEVWVTVPTVKGESHRPYRYHHEKYCVVDGLRSLVTTENWCKGSFPVSGTTTFASRGWGAVMEGADLAEGLVEVFEHDLGLSATRCAFEGTEPVQLPSPLVPPKAPPMVTAEVGILVGPEDWGLHLQHLLAPLREAEDSILLELAYLEVDWGDRVSPLVEDLLGAAGRGVDVRLVLDPGPAGEGREALERLHLLAARRGSPGVRGVLATTLPGIARVHTKGAVVDGRTAILGSLNWAMSSVSRNREVVAVVRGEAVVRNLAEAIEADWNASSGTLAPSPPPSLLLEAAARRQGPSFPRVSLRPMGQVGREEDRGPEAGGPTVWDVGRTVLVVGFFVTCWAVDRRYCLSVRANVWARGRWRRLKRRVEASSPPPSSEEGAPCAPRTTSQGKDPEREGRPEGPHPGHPEERVPRVVRLEGVP
jgi:phosphatidylserine/phosphatidylglycerophosphate/cardiolipin synthase-like enzyme